MDTNTADPTGNGTLEPTAANGVGSSSRRPGQFQKGNPGPKGLKKKETEPEPVESRVPPLLRAMRFVMTHEASRDRPGYQQHCRAWLAEDRKSFMSKMSDLEKAVTVRQSKVSAPKTPEKPPEPEAVDEGTERCRKLLTEQLAMFKEDGESERKEYERLKKKYG